MANAQFSYPRKTGGQPSSFSPLESPLSSSSMEADAFEMHFGKEGWASLPDTGIIEDWNSMPAPAEPLHPLVESTANGHLFLDPSFRPIGVDLNAGFNYDLYLDPFAATTPFQGTTETESCMGYSFGPGNREEPLLSYSAFPDYLSSHQHEALESLSTPPLYFDNPQPTPALAPPQTITSSCLAENRTPCIITATKYLRTLHIRQPTCLFRSNQGTLIQETDAPEHPRTSGNVLKSNKEAGMSVCRMLQCACALRPQNQLLLASICSRLVVWYRAMIRASLSCRPGNLSSITGQSLMEEEPALPETVVHEAVTIGDHTVDNPDLGWNIQSQVILGELEHLQRLVDTLSARIKQNSHSTLTPMGLNADANVPSIRLPEIAHGRLVTHLSAEIQAVKKGLIMASG
ncbi:hypothetical protein N7466_009694 [Penicillium verhagenii]|uniref:uncharacterized protein n=1 Tax=Penicillium verhagenii TaxID=1562060 RepID=UPI0025453F77|nr:uncharacterized protein N7466_009694 [Penicillium verhagenii]KAJ5921368.1 hypothetical protein N7466_009694 [Penicillium verhagenii]